LFPAANKHGIAVNLVLLDPTLRTSTITELLLCACPPCQESVSAMGLRVKTDPAAQTKKSGADGQRCCLPNAKAAGKTSHGMVDDIMWGVDRSVDD
jgi:hypothetical protein